MPLVRPREAVRMEAVRMECFNRRYNIDTGTTWARVRSVCSRQKEGERE